MVEKTMLKEIKVQKGQEMSKLLLLRDLMEGLDELFETIENEDADNMQKFFGANSKKIVSKRHFKAKLAIEIDD